MDRSEADNAPSFYKAIWEHVECGICIIDAGTRTILDMNPMAARMFGDDKAKVIGKLCSKVICPSEVNSCPILDKGQSVDRSERKFVRVDGQIIPIVKSVTRITFNGRPALLESFSDLSRLKEAELDLNRMSLNEREMRDSLSANYLELRRSAQQIQTQERLLSALNNVAAILLSTTAQDRVDAAIREAIGLMGDSTDIDRVYIWRNKMEDGELHYVCDYEWMNDLGRQIASRHPDTTVRTGSKFPYSRYPSWMQALSNGTILNGPLSGQPPYMRELLEPYGVCSILAFPFFFQGRFWGFITFDDCHREHAFDKKDEELLRSGSLMVASVLERNEYAANLRTVHERITLLLDAMPVCAILWDERGTPFECNEEAVRLFGVDDKREFLRRIAEFSPELQSNGKRSSDEAGMHLRKAFAEGREEFDWVHRTSGGAPVPARVALVRVDTGNGHAVAAYVRDLREFKRMMASIAKRDRLMTAINEVAAILLHVDPDGFADSLRRCLGIIGEVVDADQVYIWKSQTREDGRRSYRQLFEWSADASASGAADASHDEIPWFEENLSNDKCLTGLVRDMPPDVRALLDAHGVKSILMVPVFLRGKFWGLVGYDDCRQERVFRESDQRILRSGSLLFVDALLRDEMTRDLHVSAARLESALREAHDANQAKSDFLAMMSHEMRTPLNAIIGLSEVALDSGGLSGGDSRASFASIHSAGTTLLTTVNDILDISKIEANKFELVPQEYVFPDLLHDISTQCMVLLGEKPVKFILDVDESLPIRLWGDELRVKQIANNLLSNACKFTAEGRVELKLSFLREDDVVWLTFRVEDTGIGIRSHDLEMLFTDYTRLDATVTGKIAGTGLGLSITKRLAELMGGDVAVESEYGKGSAFTARVRQGFVDSATIGPDIAAGLRNFSYGSAKRKHNSRFIRCKLPYARVLVVDDVRLNLEVAKGLLRPYEMQIDCVAGGQEAVDAIRNEQARYDAVFMDHMMPGIDGIEATRIIREEIGTEYAKSIPIIALTANAIAGNDKLFLQKGFQAFLSKPIDAARLDAVVRQWIRDENREKSLAGQQNG